MNRSSWTIAVSLLALLGLLGVWGCSEDGSLMCGDGVRDLLEECDDANKADGDGCSQDCFIESTPDPDPEPDVLPTLASIQEHVFTPLCALAECHVVGAAAPMALDNAETSYQNLVLWPAPSPYCTNPFLWRVQPGDPERSCLMHKIESSPTAGGDPMPPPPNVALSQNRIDAIREWIALGASP